MKPVKLGIKLILCATLRPVLFSKSRQANVTMGSQSGQPKTFQLIFQHLLHNGHNLVYEDNYNSSSELVSELNLAHMG